MTSNKNWKVRERNWICKPSLEDTDKDGNKLRQRTLVLCFDGTGDTFDNDNSNVVQLTSLLKKDDPTKQMVYYQTGIGTGSRADARFELVRKITRNLDSMFAITLGDHVLGGYEFLMDNYHEGDSICIFGFSRGAYTARALAGMIQRVGLLPTGNRQQLPFAYQMFADQTKEPKHVQEFKDTFSIDVKIQFVGVWDTVESVGILPRHLPFVSSNDAIRCFRHALALDEHRAKFVPNFMHFPDQDDEDESMYTGGGSTPPLTPATPADRSLAPPTELTRSFSTDSNATVVESDSPKKDGAKKDGAKPAGTDVKEMWFAGVHTDVGGGSVKNGTRHSLARISLRWMIRECWNANTGIMFDVDKLRDGVGLGIKTGEKGLEIAEPPAPLDPQQMKEFLEGRISSLEPSFLQKAWKAAASPVTTVTSSLSRCYQWLKGHKPRKPEELPSFYAKAENAGLPREAIEELFDALSPMYDQLQMAPSWWILEWMPFWTTKEKGLHEKKNKPEEEKDKKPVPPCNWWDLKTHLSDWWKAVCEYSKAVHEYRKNHHFTINRGRGRKVYKHIMERGMLVHRSVFTRIGAVDVNDNADTYVPLVRPNIPGYTKKTTGRGVLRTMTKDEWVKKTPTNYNRPWVYELGHTAEADGSLMTKIQKSARERRKEKKASSKVHLSQ